MIDPYPSYKDSGVEWIGEIPSGWELKKLGYTIETIVPMRDKPTNLKGEIPWIRIEDYEGKYIYGSKSNQGVSNELIDEMNLKVYPVNTVLTTCSCSFGTSMIVKKPLTSNQTFIGLVPNKKQLHEEFLYYQLKIWENELDRMSSGSIQKYLSRDNFKSLRFLFPPLTEQTKIVSFLDIKTQQIDALIEKTERKIELLKEKRTSLINHCVTKGLDPNVMMKDSGVEWIGEIPKDWDSLPLKYFGQVTLGKMLTREDKGGYFLKPYLRSTNIQVEKVNISDVKEMWFSENELNRLRLKKGDLLFNEGGDVGRTCQWNEEINECYIQNSVNRVRLPDDNERYYLHLSILYHSVGYYDSLVNRVSIPHLTKEKLESVTFLRPSFHEQTQIVDYLDEQTHKIDTSIGQETQRSALLKEYRQSLISEVVTGKVRVTKARLEAQL